MASTDTASARLTTTGSGTKARSGNGATARFIGSIKKGARPARTFDVNMPHTITTREKFIPVTRFALIDRLASADVWPGGHAEDARRFFRYLDYWRQQQYTSELFDLEQIYEPFSPDSDLLMTRKFTNDDRRAMQRRIVEGMAHILTRANYEMIDPSDATVILTRDSYYGLDFKVDLALFEECLIFYRGATARKDQRRRMRKFFRKEEFDVPIFQRFFLLFKLKPFDVHVKEVMAEQKISRSEAMRVVRRRRSMLPPSVKEENIYMKLFKNLPRSDIEMVFPNTEVKFRFFDKLKLGVSAGGGLGMGAVGAAGKIALVASNPLAAATAAAGFGAVAFRQAMNFINQRNRYMVVLAQNLYFHSMADNRGVMVKLAARAAEEDVKEEILLYSVLAKEPARRADLPVIDAAIEQYLLSQFGASVDFDLEDALERLLADGIVSEGADGVLTALAPAEAALHIDDKWDLFLNNLPDPVSAEGMEFEGNPVA
jgi:hypothetical protein